MNPTDVEVDILERFNKTPIDGLNSKQIFEEIVLKANEEVLYDEKCDVAIEEALMMYFIEHPEVFEKEVTRLIDSIENSVSTPDSDQTIQHDTTLKVINYFINFFKNLEIDSIPDEDLTTVHSYYKKIVLRLGDYIHNAAEQLFQNLEDAYKFALIFYVLSGVDDDYNLKKGCYLHLLGQTGLPEEFDLADYCQRFPQKWIDLFNKLNKDKLVFESLSEDEHVYAQLEFIKLCLLTSRAYSELSNHQASITSKQIAKNKLLKLLGKEKEVRIANISVKYFSDDVDVLVNLADYYFRVANPEKGMNILHKARHILETFNKNNLLNNYNVDIKVIQLYAYLLLSKSEEFYEEGYQIFLQAAKAGNLSVLDYLQKISKHDDKIIISLAKIHLQLALTADIKYKNLHAVKSEILISSVNWIKYPEAYYISYLIMRNFSNILSISSLAYSARKGIKKAFEELVLLANTGNNREACYHLGLIYLEAQDYNLAIEYFKKSGMENAKFELAEMILREIRVDNFDPIEEIKNIIIIPMQLTSNEIYTRSISLLERFTEKENPYKAKAILILAQYYFYGWDGAKNPKKSASYYTLYHTFMPNEFSNLVGPLRSQKIVFHLSNQMIAKIFIGIYKNEDLKIGLIDDDFKMIAGICVDREDAQLDSILLSCPELGKHLNDKNVIDVLDRMKVIQDSRSLAKLVVSFIATRENPDIYFHWLQDNSDVLSSLLQSFQALKLLTGNPKWKEFLNSDSVRTIIDKNALIKSENNTDVSTVSNILPFFKQKINPETFLIKAQTAYTEKKDEVYLKLLEREGELKASNDTGHLYVITKMIKAFNHISNDEDLDTFIEKLCEQDDYFRNYFLQFSH